MVRRIVLLVVLCAFLAPGSARATSASSCGGSWNGEGSCTLKMRGRMLSVGLWTRDPGAAVVRVEGPGPAGSTIVLLDCEAVSVAIGGCAAVGDQHTLYTDYPAGTELTCVVVGVTGGSYGCDSP